MLFNNDPINEKGYDSASCKEAWNHYKKFYEPFFGGEYDFDNLFHYNHYKDFGRKSGYIKNEKWYNYTDEKKTDNNRLFALKKGTKIIQDGNNKYSESAPRLGGECDFNFNLRKKEEFKKIIGNDEKTLKKLNECFFNHNKPVNLSLMQAIGGMRKVKGKDKFDRLDRFIWQLSLYFDDKPNEILSEANENKDTLEEYLKGFSDIYDYCKKIYFIEDDDFVDEIIRQGQLPIENCTDANRYMDLALSFWNLKQQYFIKKLRAEMKPHQIMTIVGNGFDTSVLNKYGDTLTTSYDNFYRFFNYRYPNDSENIFIKQMEQLKDNQKNWSDLENVLSTILRGIDNSPNVSVDKINSDLSRLQIAFSRFLNEVVNDDIIKKLSEGVSSTQNDGQSLAYRSLSCFLKDLPEEDYKRIGFKSAVKNHDKLEMVFINFNYTSLLDNYVYLDKDSFDPHKFKSGNNFHFYSNPNKYDGLNEKYDDPYCLLHTSLFHPHGFQNVPKSILFGTEFGNSLQINDEFKPFIKSYWAQCELNYADLFNDTELFIIYGCSIGESDKWWWKRIYDKVLNENAELIIYNYGSESKTLVVDKFITSCGKKLEKCKADKDNSYNKIYNNTYVINHGSDNDNKIIFLQLPD